MSAERPPGTGKPYFISHSCIPFPLSKPETQIVIAVPSNLIADQIASDLEERRVELIRKYGDKYPARKGKKIMRVYTKGADRQYRDLPAEEMRQKNKKLRAQSKPRPLSISNRGCQFNLWRTL